MARFVKGVSGNPGGRPKAQGDLRELARQHTAAALRVLEKVMNDETAPPSARVNAASAMLDRGHGHPQQSIRASIDSNQVPIDSVLDGLASDLIKKIRGQPENTRETEPQPIPALSS